MTNNAILEEITKAAILEGTIKENEQLHTFLYWKSNGYHVKRGEKACVTTKLWKRKTRKQQENEENEENENSDRDYIIVNAYLFSSSQVEKASKN